MSNTMFQSIGTKGSDVFSSTSSALNDLYIRLNRGLPEAEINRYVDVIMQEGSQQAKLDLIVLAFQTRDVRGGKGERVLARQLWIRLADYEPEALAATVPLLPEYGRWEDLVQLAHGVYDSQPGVYNTIMTRLADQLKADNSAVIESRMNPEVGTPRLSLVARHMPRENDKVPRDAAFAKQLAGHLFPGDKKRHQKYRQLVSGLSKEIGVPEIAMSAKNWSSLNPVTMPGRCLMTKLKGLLNKPVCGFGRKVVLQDPDRVACAEKFSEHLKRARRGEAKVKGANVVFPHELAAKVLKHFQTPETVQRWVPGTCGSAYDDECDSDSDEGSSGGKYVDVPNPDRLSAEELDGIEAQWQSILDPIKAAGVLGEWLPMCDFSGSMTGDPMHVSLALGLIVSECNTGVFKGCILTFDSTPMLYKFRHTGLVQRVQELLHAGVGLGLSTDFQAAYNLVLRTLIDNGVAAQDAPKYLLVLTDMAFDDAVGYNGPYKHAVKTAGHETHVQIARRAFVKQGDALFGDGKGWAAPTIIVWNLRDLPDFQALAQEEGVLQVSGWSPSLLTTLATRGLEAFNSETVVRLVLDNPRYDAVREAVRGLLMPELLPEAGNNIDYEDVD